MAHEPAEKVAPHVNEDTS